MSIEFGTWSKKQYPSNANDNECHTTKIKMCKTNSILKLAELPQGLSSISNLSEKKETRTIDSKSTIGTNFSPDLVKRSHKSSFTITDAQIMKICQIVRKHGNR